MLAEPSSEVDDMPSPIINLPPSAKTKLVEAIFSGAKLVKTNVLVPIANVVVVVPEMVIPEALRLSSSKINVSLVVNAVVPEAGNVVVVDTVRAEGGAEYL